MQDKNNLLIFLLALVALTRTRIELDATDSGDAPTSPLSSPLSAVRVVPMVNKTFGADVFGFEPVSMANDAVAMAIIADALDDHLVLHLHDVADTLSAEKHLAMARHLGTVDAAVSSPPTYLLKGVFNSPDQVAAAHAKGLSAHDLGRTMRLAAQTSTLPSEITRVVKEPADAAAFGEGWHTDLSYLAAPPAAALLVARQLPARGLGNTQFLDMRAALRSLPAPLRALAETSQANHTDGDERWSLHPVTRRDGREPSLFVNKAFTRSILRTEGNELRTLLAHVDSMPHTQPQASLDLEWRDGDVIIWDNRFTQHAATGNYKTRREMHRILVSGNTPF